MTHLDPEAARVGGIVLANRATLRDAPASIAAAAALLRDVLTHHSLTGAYPPPWNDHKLDAALALIECSADGLYRLLTDAVGEDDSEGDQ